MRVLLSVGCLFAVAVAAMGCNNVDPAPLYIDIDYQVRCLDCEPRSPDDPARRIALINGELGYQMDCHTSVVDGDEVLSFSILYSDPDDSSARHEIAVDRVDYQSGQPGSKCEVSVRERSNLYEGGCTGSTPTADEPCQIEINVEDGVVRGEILCLEIPNSNIVTSTRNLVHSDETGEPDERPAVFEIYGCTGIPEP